MKIFFYYQDNDKFENALAEARTAAENSAKIERKYIFSMFFSILRY